MEWSVDEIHVFFRVELNGFDCEDDNEHAEGDGNEEFDDLKKDFFTFVRKIWSSLLTCFAPYLSTSSSSSASVILLSLITGF